MELENKTIIITGASSGIGAAAARLFAQEGASVVLGARRSAELEALVAGIKQRNGVGSMASISDMHIENWNDVLSVNLTAAFYAAKAQIPAMKKRGGGSIVFTSSFVGYSNAGLPGMGAYAASKAALIGLMQSLAADHAADGIRVNALLPGGTVTPSGGEGNQAVMEFVANLHPMKRMASATEIAQAALFLLSDRSSFMTGSPMIADGGMSVRLV